MRQIAVGFQCRHAAHAGGGDGLTEDLGPRRPHARIAHDKDEVIGDCPIPFIIVAPRFFNPLAGEGMKPPENYNAEDLTGPT